MTNREDFCANGSGPPREPPGLLEVAANGFLRLGTNLWARFLPQIMRGIMRAVGAIMRSPNMDRRF
jgi:hypothetical protein